jgi:hypothetical protein
VEVRVRAPAAPPVDRVRITDPDPGCPQQENSRVGALLETTLGLNINLMNVVGDGRHLTDRFSPDRGATLFEWDLEAQSEQ